MIVDILIPITLSGIAAYAWMQGIDVFSTFIQGVQKGLRIAIGLFPTVLGLLTAVYMLRASGCIDMIGALLQPIFIRLGIPQECAALVLLKPISGSGGLALGSEIIHRCGVDSYTGRVAAVMLGASETSLYTIGIYCSHIGLQNAKSLIPIALVGDIIVFVLSAFLVRHTMM